MLRFLHISDIHFATTFDGAPELDVDAEVRERMLVDFARMRERCGEFDGILLVGDVAAKGKEGEYLNAARFLANATEIIGCPPDRAACVPGNHDIDRGLQVPVHQHLRASLRAMAPEAVSDALVALTREDLSSTVLFRPLTEYNKFALAYDCDVGPGRVMWPPKTFRLGECTLEIHGITSCWIADGTEKPEPGLQLAGGMFQAIPIRSDALRVCMTLCHHPPTWLLDADVMKPWIAQASIVLTGHEHIAGLSLSEDERTLYIASGAVNPERTHHGWLPAYNVIELEVSSENDVVVVSTYVRMWQGAQGHAEFGPDPDQEDPVVNRVKIGAGAPPPPEPPDIGRVVTDLPPEPMTSAKHSQVHTIMSASPDDRYRVAAELGIEPPGDLRGLEADRALLNLANKQNLLAELAARLVQRSDDV